jgi:predicted RND superfamily exporter protein
MMNFNKRTTVFFEWLGSALYRRAWFVIAAMLLLTVLLGSQLPKMTIDTSTESFFHDSDPVILKYNHFQEQFGRDDVILLTLNPPEIFSLEFIKKLDALHQAIERDVPNVAKVTSLINVRSTRGLEDELLVDELLDEWPRDAVEMAAFRARVMANPLYENSLISKDGKFTTITIQPESFSTNSDVAQEEIGMEVDLLADFDDDGMGLLDEIAPNEEATEERQFLTDEEKSAIVISLLKVVGENKTPEFPIYMAGSPVVDHKIKGNLQRDMALFVNLGLVVIAVVLFLLFRRISVVLLALLIVVLSLISTLGMMALNAVPITIPTQILPSFLLAVGVADSVHILSLFFKRLELDGNRQAAITYALSHSGRAVVLTSLTTAGGLMSFMTSDLAPVADLGVYAPIGVIFTLLYSLILLPSLLAVIPLRGAQAPAKTPPQTAIVDQLLCGTAEFAMRNARVVVLLCALLIVVAFLGASRLRFSYDPLSWLPEKDTVRSDTRMVDEHMRGSLSFEIMLDTGIENGWYEPELLQKLDLMSREAEAYQGGDVFVGKTSSVADFIKEINQALNENRGEFYRVPEAENMVAQELFLFESSGSDDLEDVIDRQYRNARFTMKLPALDAVEYSRFVVTMERRFREVFGEGVEVAATGIVALLFKTISAMILSMAHSYVIALAVISVMMIILLGNVKLGLMSMVPNLAPIVMTLGLMGWMGIPLDAFTLLIGSIAIGLVVDDTIHIMDKFKAYYDQDGDVSRAVSQTLKTTGRAILATSIVLSCGFLIYICSSMKNLVYFGTLTTFTILAALVADVVLLPALMKIFIRDKPGTAAGPAGEGKPAD